MLSLWHRIKIEPASERGFTENASSVQPNSRIVQETAKRANEDVTIVEHVVVIEREHDSRALALRSKSLLFSHFRFFLLVLSTSADKT